MWQIHLLRSYTKHIITVSYSKLFKLLLTKKNTITVLGLFCALLLAFTLKPALFYSIILFVAVLGFPGYLLSLVLLNNRKIEFFSSVSVLVSFGIILFIIPTLTAYLLKLSWFYFVVLLSTEILVVLIWIILKRISFAPKFIMGPDRYDLVAIIVSVVTSIAMLLQGGHFIGDAMFHLASVIKLVENAIIDPSAPMFKDVAEISFNYAYNIWYGVLALIVKAGAVSLRNLWDVGPSIFTFYLFSAVYFFSNRLFKNKMAGALCVLSFFVYEWLKFGELAAFADFRSLPYPDQIARNGLLLVAFGIMIDEANSKRDVVLKSVTITLLLTSIILVHMYSFAAFFIISAVFYVLVLVFYNDVFYKKQGLIVLLTALLANLPLLYIRLGLSNFNISYAITPTVDIKYLRFFEARSLWSNPYILITLVVAGFAIFYLMKFVIRRFSDYSKSILFLLTCAVIYTLMNIERINAVAGHFISYAYSRRLADYALYPYLFCSAFVYYLFLIWRNKKWVVWIGFGCILIVLFIASFNLYHNSRRKGLYNREYVLRQSNVYAYIENNIPKWQVFASYGYPSLEIVSQVPQYIIGGMNTHLPPVEGNPQRAADLIRLFSFNLPITEYMSILDKYDCDYLLLTLAQKKKAYSLSLVGGKEWFSIDKANEFVHRFPAIFYEIYKDDRYVLYKVKRNS